MKLQYRPDIDCLRAVAVLVVVACHMKVRHFTGGYVGVDVFFVISGYLIARMIYTETVEGHFSFIAFYERRIRRIVPALYLVVAVAVVAALILLPPSDLVSFSRSVLAVVTFTSNMLFWQESGYFDSPSAEKPLLHAWSLSVEEQFYLVFPICIFFLARWAPKRESVWLSVGALVSLAICIWAFRIDPTAAFYLAPCRAWEFLLGAILAVGAVADPKTRSARIIAAAVGLALIAFSVIAYSETTFPGVNAVVPCLGSALFIWANSGQPTAKLGVVTRILVFFGQISYSLYLWHWPVLVFARSLPGFEDITGLQKISIFGATVFVSYLSYRYVEQPVRKRTIAIPRRALFAWTSVASVLLFASGIAGVAFAGFPQRTVGTRIMAYTNKNNFDDLYREGTCFLTLYQPFADFRVDECASKQSNAKNILVWGDSLAAHYVYGLQQFGRKSDINIMQATAGACAPIFDFDFAHFNKNCSGFNEGIRSVIEARLPDAVILSASWSAYIEYYGSGAVFEGLRKTIARLTGLGIKVILFGPSIEYTQSLPGLLYRSSLFGYERFDSAKYLNHKIFDVDDRMNKEFSDVPGVYFISILKSVCAADSCPTVVAGSIPVQFDTGHLTGPGSEFVISKVFPAIAAQLGTARP